MITNHTPYVKKYKNGILVNPITKENPYLFGKEKINLGQRFWSTVRNKFFTGMTVIKN